MDTASPNTKKGVSAGSARSRSPGLGAAKSSNFIRRKMSSREILTKYFPDTCDQPILSATSTAVPSRSQINGELNKCHACPVCNKIFSSPSKLSDHQYLHTGESPYYCQLCDKKYNSKSKIVRHLITHRSTRAYTCHVCNKSFHRKDHLRNHMQVHNPVRRILVCERAGCGKQYSTALSFSKHSAIHAAEEGQLDCTICGTAFSDSSNLMQHLKTHTAFKRTVKNCNVKKYSCVDCGRSFAAAKDLRRHQVVHTGRRDFSCPYCPQEFGRKDHLARHIKNTHPDRTYHIKKKYNRKLTESGQIVVGKTEQKSKCECLTYLGLKYIPSILVNVLKSGNSTTQTEIPVKKSGDTLIFTEVPIEIDTTIKKETQEIDTSLDDMTMKTEISS